MCHMVLLGGLMILAPHIVLCALRTVTYAHGASWFFQDGQTPPAIGRKRFAPAFGKTTQLEKVGLGVGLGVFFGVSWSSYLQSYLESYPNPT
jgi:hypothetical protein